MKPEEFQERCKPYWDIEDLFADRPNPVGKWNGGNMLLDTAMYYLILRKLGWEPTEQDRERFFNQVFQCAVPSYIGLFNRNPGRTDLQAHDDYTGVAAASSFMRPMLARGIYLHGCEHFWSYNNVEPSKWTAQTFHGRFLGQVPHYHACTDRDPGIFSRLAWVVDLQASAHSESASGVRLAWCRVEAMRSRPFAPKLAIAYWEDRVNRIWKDMGRVFTAYHGERHPFACAMKGLI